MQRVFYQLVYDIVTPEKQQLLWDEVSYAARRPQLKQQQQQQQHLFIPKEKKKDKITVIHKI